MIKSILTQIWNQRRLNGWIFAELLIVFVLLWYCLDMLYAFAYAERQPKGYDLEHVYKVSISTNPTQLVLCSQAYGGSIPSYQTKSGCGECQYLAWL